jgi:hypothetical protein
VSGDGELTAAVDAYGDVVDLRPGPAGAALIDNPADRQAAGTVPEDTGIVPRVWGRAMWEADAVTQRYLPGTNVVRTVARFGSRRVVMTTAATGRSLAMKVRVRAGGSAGASGSTAAPSLTFNVHGIRCARERRAAQLDLVCGPARVALPVPAAGAGDGGGSRPDRQARSVSQKSSLLIASAAKKARRWLRRSGSLGEAGASDVGSRSVAASLTQAPPWAEVMYRRSLLTIHALTSRRTAAVAAGARDGWAYVWPRDAATAAMALEAAGHSAEARRVTRFLTHLDLPAAARFTESGGPVPGRAAQGDALGWVTVAARTTGLPAPRGPYAWRNRADYQESTPGTYLANALANADSHQHQATRESARIAREFGGRGGLVREAGDPSSGLDSAAAWAVRPFGLTQLYPAAERTLLRLLAQGTRYGITPGEGWEGGDDPWTAPTAWSAWSLASLSGDRRPGVRGPRTNLPAVRERGVPSCRAPSRRTPRQAALELLQGLRRASTPAGALPERVGVHTGIPTSTTPLLWSSAFTVLALRELWR